MEGGENRFHSSSSEKGDSAGLMAPGKATICGDSGLSGRVLGRVEAAARFGAPFFGDLPFFDGSDILADFSAAASDDFSVLEASLCDLRLPVELELALSDSGNSAEAVASRKASSSCLYLMLASIA